MPATACPTCGSTDLRDDVRPIGRHYGKRVCPDGHHCGWLPKPPDGGTPLPAEVAALVVPRSKPVSLKGTPGQVGAARMLRFNTISFHEKAGDRDFVALLKCVNDATWFLANKGRGPVDLKCWPRADQMEPVAEVAER